MIVLATGYRQTFPFMHEQVRARPVILTLYLFIFVPLHLRTSVSSYPLISLPPCSPSPLSPYLLVHLLPLSQDMTPAWTTASQWRIHEFLQQTDRNVAVLGQEVVDRLTFFWSGIAKLFAGGNQVSR